MLRVNSYEFRTQFTHLMTRINNGEEIIICSGGKDIAKVIPFARENFTRTAGMDINQATIADDFNDDLPAIIQQLD